jgi:hypothetical protein
MARLAPKPRLTDRERHKRFVDMAREVGAAEDSEAFDHAFARVTQKTTAGDEPAAESVDPKVGPKPA